MTGTVVVAGRRYRITRLELRGGLLHIIASGSGPNPLLADEPATVFGQDGIGVGQGWKVTIPETSARESVTIILPLRLVSIENG